MKMNRTMGIALAASVLACFASKPAFAQESISERGYTYLRQTVRAPSNAFEIGVDTGFVQGFGNLYGTKAVSEVAGPGGNVGISLGWRATPLFGFGWHGGLQDYARRGDLPSGTGVRGLTTSVEFNFHLAPYMRVDPWLGVGTGYRNITESPPGPIASGTVHGLEIVKLQGGFDLRPKEMISIGPMLGADLNYNVWNRGIGTETTARISDRRFSTFLYAGVKGRFDVAGTRKSPPALYEAGR
jgi:hypothetical protein